jgi:O-antigen/teichoic acid export membrane protein
MISLIKGDIETGLYSVSYNFIFGISLIASLASASVYPYLSRVYKIKTEIKNVNKYIKMFFLLGCSMGLILFFLSRKLIELFYGIEYSESTLSLRILSLSLPFSFACTFLGTFIASINKQIVGTLITGLVAFLNIILNFILIEKFGHAGAAVASLISFFLMFLMLLIAYLFYSSNKSKK